MCAIISTSGHVGFSQEPKGVSYSRPSLRNQRDLTIATDRTGAVPLSFTAEHPGWQPGWRRYVEHDGVRVVMHGKGPALFICFLREDDAHDTHMVTENTPEAERVFGEICEVLRAGAIS